MGEPGRACLRLLGDVQAVWGKGVQELGFYLIMGTEVNRMEA